MNKILLILLIGYAAILIAMPGCGDDDDSKPDDDDVSDAGDIDDDDDTDDDDTDDDDTNVTDDDVTDDDDDTDDDDTDIDDTDDDDTDDDDTDDDTDDDDTDDDDTDDDDTDDDDTSPIPDRGDLDDFPKQCLGACDEACTALENCGAFGEEAELFDIDDCLSKCDSAQNDLWDDVSVNFLCCATQPNCEDVAKCGGWLNTPYSVPACERLCECYADWMYSPSGKKVFPPKGYRFSCSKVMVETAGLSIDYNASFSATVETTGKYKLLNFNSAMRNPLLKKLYASEKTLPTFIDASGKTVAATGDIIVKLDSANGLKKLKAALGSAKLIKMNFGDNLYKVRTGNAWGMFDALAAVKKIENVKSEPDMIRLYERRYKPNDPKFAEQWHLLNEGLAGAVAGADSRVAEAWDITKGSADVVIAINDDGVDIHHPDLAANALEPYNFPNGWEQSLGDDYFAFGWHGTGCAGVAAAVADNKEGGAGVCPGCKILPSLSHGDGSEGYDPNSPFGAADSTIAEIMAGVVDAGASIISNSWGPADGNPTVAANDEEDIDLPEIIRAAFEHAETEGRGGKGTLVFYAAGNGNESVDLDPLASYETNVAVAAVDDQGLKSSYSDFGATLDIAAPSDGGLNGIITTLGSKTSETDPEYWDDFGGTSSACPFAAGVAGLVLSANPDLTAAEVRDILKNSATKIDPLWGGWNEEGFSPYYGYGLLNAYRAVTLATAQCASPFGCTAPSDNCAENCQTTDACGVCRTDADCKEGFNCQSLPLLGQMVCIEKTDADCADGFEKINGFCVPGREACALCGGAEECNGRDDNCDGEADDGLDCSTEYGDKLCLMENTVCGEGGFCSGGYCVALCETDEDCDNGSCLPAKDRYGNSDEAVKICDVSWGGGSYDCMTMCQVSASSLDDDKVIAFSECTLDERNSCDDVFWYCLNDFPY